MTSRLLSRSHEILAILLMFTVAATGLSYQVSPDVQNSGVEGQFMAAASGMEPDTVHKEVGQSVHIKAKIKNIGSVEATYIIIAKYRMEGTDDWVQCGIEDLRLEPGTYETMLISTVLCCDEMAGAYFDIKLLLYDAGTETLLDEAVMERAWYVEESVPEGSIYDYWIE